MDMSVGTACRYTLAARLDQIAYWNPLPVADSLSGETVRLVRESDGFIKAGKIESALDTSLLVNSLAPDYIQGFIRTSELLIATDRRDRALALTSSITRLQGLSDGPAVDLEIAKILAHLESTSENTLRIARHVLESRSRRMLIPYVPAAIDNLAAEERFDDACSLAEEWVSRSGNDPVAQAYYIREHLRTGDIEGASKTLARFCENHDAYRV